MARCAAMVSCSATRVLTDETSLRPRSPMIDETREAVLADLSMATDRAPVWPAACRTALPRLSAFFVLVWTSSDTVASFRARVTSVAARS